MAVYAATMRFLSEPRVITEGPLKGLTNLPVAVCDEAILGLFDPDVKFGDFMKFCGSNELKSAFIPDDMYQSFWKRNKQPIKLHNMTNCIDNCIVVERKKYAPNLKALQELNNGWLLPRPVRAQIPWYSKGMYMFSGVGYSAGGNRALLKCVMIYSPWSWEIPFGPNTSCVLLLARLDKKREWFVFGCTRLDGFPNEHFRGVYNLAHANIISGLSLVDRDPNMELEPYFWERDAALIREHGEAFRVHGVDYWKTWTNAEMSAEVKDPHEEWYREWQRRSGDSKTGWPTNVFTNALTEKLPFWRVKGFSVSEWTNKSGRSQAGSSGVGSQLMRNEALKDLKE